ncbi:type II methionyl aminopeptidase [Candidatus Woesearchaeota archaeon]|nr:type II methionyl aminopeptidase [Candidatus Woesearchaeota archaeon]
MTSLEDWHKAGHAAHEALIYGASLIKVGVKYSDISDSVEKKLKELGANLAFPVNISINATAAHDVPYSIEERKFTENDLVKLDVGAEINGAIGDNALTVDLTGKHSDLVKASKDARDKAIEIIKPGIKLREIGKVIEKTIISYGFQPIRNLSGHSLEPYTIHAGTTIPNHDDGSNETLKEGMIIAIEPFATTGDGLIHEGNNAEIFALVQKKPVRSLVTREALKYMEERKGLPTSSRWLAQKITPLKANFALKEMNQLEMIHTYPPLIEVKKGLVSQSEHTILVTKEGCEILTK